MSPLFIQFVWNVFFHASGGPSGGPAFEKLGKHVFYGNDHLFHHSPVGRNPCGK
jgi:hypothetical protein